ncbi:MAG: DUF2007 domain-containing protein [Candidatus Krumholzibacteriia bacterium]
MPFCPQCRCEYTEETSTCEDCRVDLVAQLPDPTSDETQGALVEVWYTQGEMEAQLIRSLLESSGINSMFSGESLRLTHGFTVDGLAEVKILVREQDAERAREIISAQEEMRRCPGCGQPAHKRDAVCHYCKTQLS